ncbi:MAG: GDP-mannose 4,6-dehydratase [Candidatus Omnitrophica bacterium]|nr:GDP-mannose 4,6-dehydratase [Candidatus Omnitrophota bacterium]
MSRKIVVIGSNSFSGSDFVDLLLEDSQNEVIGISRSPEKSEVFLPYKRHANPHFRFVQLDLNLQMRAILDLLEEEKPEFIVNFAAQSEVAPSWEDPAQWFRTNAVCVAELGHYLRKAAYLKRYVHISSPEVYGTCSGRVTEDAPFNPTTPYAASKAAGDMFLWTLVKNFNFPLIMIRATNVYGAHQQLHKIIPRSVIYIKKKKVIELHGGGTAVKSYIHIRDVSRGELAAMEHGKPGRMYHFSPDGGIAVKDLVAMICRKMEVDFGAATRVVGERLGQDAAYVIDSSRARGELGWQPRITLEEGVNGLADWVQQHWPQIENQNLEYAHKP